MRPATSRCKTLLQIQKSTTELEDRMGVDLQILHSKKQLCSSRNSGHPWAAHFGSLTIQRCQAALLSKHTCSIFIQGCLQGRCSSLGTPAVHLTVTCRHLKGGEASLLKRLHNLKSLSACSLTRTFRASAWNAIPCHVGGSWHNEPCHIPASHRA